MTQYGKRVFDCSGLIKGYLWSENFEDAPRYNMKEDFNSRELMEFCELSENFDMMPDVPGLILFFKGHVGVYTGNGDVIEARGHAFGVVETKLKERPWKKWGKLKLITYE